MALLGVVLGLGALVLTIFATLDVLSALPERVRVLPKLVWLPVVLLLPVLGPVAWLMLGRPRAPGTGGLPPSRRGPNGGAPDDDESFLRGLRERAEKQREAERRRHRHED